MSYIAVTSITSSVYISSFAQVVRDRSEAVTFEWPLSVDRASSWRGETEFLSITLGESFATCVKIDTVFLRYPLIQTSWPTAYSTASCTTSVLVFFSFPYRRIPSTSWPSICATTSRNLLSQCHSIATTAGIGMRYGAPHDVHHAPLGFAPGCHQLSHLRKGDRCGKLRARLVYQQVRMGLGESSFVRTVAGEVKQYLAPKPKEQLCWTLDPSDSSSYQAISIHAGSRMV
ncbi:hypothetical protein OF83DRAFT_155818 [Amylostereum chailletii]|nr:hypothetical protein OF83DRAFT_155818 [Amylostereum chailletii]